MSLLGTAIITPLRFPEAFFDLLPSPHMPIDDNGDDDSAIVNLPLTLYQSAFLPIYCHSSDDNRRFNGDNRAEHFSARPKLRFFNYPCSS